MSKYIFIFNSCWIIIVQNWIYLSTFIQCYDAIYTFYLVIGRIKILYIETANDKLHVNLIV